MRRWGSRPGPATIRSASTQSRDCSAVALACTVQGPMTTSEKHYNGFRATLVRLAAVDVDELEELITDAWRAGPRTVVAEFDDHQAR
jgi:hypothetical protein